MSLHIEMEQIGDVAVLKCAGRIVHGAELCLKDVVTSLPQVRVIVLALSAVAMLDAAVSGCWSFCITGLVRAALT